MTKKMLYLEVTEGPVVVHLDLTPQQVTDLILDASAETQGDVVIETLCHDEALCEKVRVWLASLDE